MQNLKDLKCQIDNIVERIVIYKIKKRFVHIRYIYIMYYASYIRSITLEPFRVELCGVK